MSYMKRALVLGMMVFLLSSCMVYPKYSAKTYFTDCTKYTQDGFFITQSNSVSFDYQLIGLVNTLVLTGASEDGTTLIQASEDDVLYNLCEKSMLQKANGIIDLKITPYYDPVTKQQGLSGSAMAIKRK